jgi:predicted DNA-binding transcriptional regulator YafY
MSKRGYISRYLLILKKLKVRPYASYEDLQKYIENQVEYLQMRDDNLSVAFSKRTLQRDIKEIRNIFGIDVEFSKTEKGYYIVQSEMENMNFQRMLESFDMFNSLKVSQDMSTFILLEKRRPQGTENLYGIIHAIKNQLQISFNYEKFWDERITYRTVSPYALKEFKNRWYILAMDVKDGQVKSFALDRLTELEITKYKFTLPNGYDAESNYRFSFGIISPNSKSPQEIVLSFNTYQGKYIKTLPLHETQQILADDNAELRIKLRLFITHDFIMELLSFGENVIVIQPQSLIDEIKTAHKKAFNQYSLTK